MSLVGSRAGRGSPYPIVVALRVFGRVQADSDDDSREDEADQGVDDREEFNRMYDPSDVMSGP